MRLNTVEVIFRIVSNKKGTGVDITRVGELVRCGDCRYWRPTDCGSRAECAMFGVESSASWYCGSAEKRKET